MMINDNMDKARKFIEMYDKYDFDIFKPYLAEDIVWYSSYSNMTYTGLKNLEEEYYIEKMKTLKESKTKILDYSIIKFKDMLVSLGRQKVVVKGKENNNAKVMVQQPNNGLCVRLGQFYRTGDKNSVTMNDALFHLEFNQDNKINKISVLNDVFLKKGKYDVLETKTINDAWDNGIPEYVDEDLLEGQELLRVGLNAIIPYIQEDGYEILDVNGNIELFPHIIAKKDGVLCAVYVDVGIYPNHPSINELTKEGMREFSKKYNANIYYAPVSFMSIDNERAEAGILLKYDKQYCRYEGLEEIV